MADQHEEQRTVELDDLDEAVSGGTGAPAAHVVKVKWLAEGAETLGQVADALRYHADRFDGMEQRGWQLSEPVCGGAAVSQHGKALRS